MSEKKKKNVSSVRMSGLVENIQIHNEIPVLERIKYPIIWERMTSGYRIQDLQPSKIESAIDIIRDYYIEEEPMCKGVDLSSHPDGVEEYLKMMTAWLKDTQSLAAIEEGSGMFVGVLIGRVLDKTVRTQSRIVNTDSNMLINKPMESINEICKPSACQEEFLNADKDSKKLKGHRLSRKSLSANKSQMMRISSAPSTAADKSKSRSSKLTIKKNSDGQKMKDSLYAISSQYLRKPMFDDDRMLFENPVLMKIQRFRSRVSRNCDLLKMYDVPSYYSIHLMLVIPDHRGKGIGKALLRCAMDMSRKFKCDVIAGTFTSKIAQNIAHKEQFKVLQEVRLCDWCENEEPVFTEITDLTETAAMMALRMRDPPPPEIPVPQTPPRRKSRVHAS